MFTFGYFLQSEMNAYKVMLTQKLPWFGTLRTRGEKAAVDADAALASFYNERNRVFAEVKKAYFEYAFLGESIRVTESQLEVLDYMEDIVRSKYEVGMASEDELLRISIEKTKVRDRRDGFLQFRPALMARLNDSLGVEVAIERPWPQEAELPEKLPPADTIRAQIRTANPDLSRLESLIESRAKQVKLAKKEGCPNFTLGLEYVSIDAPSTVRPDRPYPATLNALARQRAAGQALKQSMFQAVQRAFSGQQIQPLQLPSASNTVLDLYSIATANEPMSYPDNPDDNVMISVSVNLPIWRKRVRAGVAEAQMLKEAATNEKRRSMLELDKAAEMTIFAVEDAERRFALFRDSLTPQAKRSYESLQSQYAAGDLGTSFLDLLDSIQTLLGFELEQVRATRDWQVGAAELEFLTGGPWGSAQRH
jgi:outer membrane protein TolC